MALESSFLRYLISDYFYDLPRFPVERGIILYASTFPIRVELFTELRPNDIKNKVFPLWFSLKKYALRIIFFISASFPSLSVVPLWLLVLNLVKTLEKG